MTTMRRALGYKLRRDEKLLVDFIGFVEASAEHRITIDLAVAWATAPAGGTIDSVTEVPPRDLLPRRSHRAVPYLYSDDDIIALITAAGTLLSPLRALTYQTLIPLLAVTGGRASARTRSTWSTRS